MSLTFVIYIVIIKEIYVLVDENMLNCPFVQ